MILRDTIWHEWRTTLSRPAALATLLLLFALFAYGSLSGRVEHIARADAIATHEEEVREAQATWLNQIETLETKGPGPGVPPWAGSPMDVTLSSSLPPAPLADFAIGQSDLLPYLGVISLWDPDMRLFSRYELDDPVSLALGGFDLSKAIIIVLPLVLIVLCFDVLSADRDANRQALVLTMAVGIRRLFWQRMSIRAAVVIGSMLAVGALALVIPIPTTTLLARVPFFALWMLVAVLYGLFWLALIAFVASCNRSGAMNIAALLLAWAGLTLLLPASVSAIAEAVHPLPSRPAWLAEAREIEIQTELAESDAFSRFIVDHPELVIDETSHMPAYVRTAFLATRAVDEATLSILRRFDLAASGREKSLSFMRYLSPAIAVHGVLADISGSSARRHRDLMTAARAMKADYARRAGHAIVAGRRLSLDEARTLPEARLPVETPRVILARNVDMLAFLIVITALLLLVANWRLRRMEVPA